MRQTISLKKEWIIGVFLAAVLALSGAALADDVKDSIQEAVKAYEAADYTSAIQSLDYASQLIRQKKGEKLEALLPQPLEGWKAEATSSEAAGAAMFGGGVTAKRTYTRDSSTVDVEVITDSPMLQSFMMMFTNPMFVVSEGGKLEKVGNQRAIVKYSPTDREGEIKIAVANRILITVSGSDVSKEDLKAYAERIDYKKLEELP